MAPKFRKIKSKEELEAAVDILFDIQNSRDERKTTKAYKQMLDHQARAAEIQSDLDKEDQQFQEQEKKMLAMIQEYMEGLPAEVKSVKCINGVVKTRRSSTIVIEDSAACLAALKKMKLTDCIRKLEEPDKTAIKKLEPKVQEQLGVEIKTKTNISVALNNQ